MHASLTPEVIMSAIQADDNLGFCKVCGIEVQGVEPDARYYKCEACDARQVFGAEELLFEIEG